ncbi:MAG TPA: hypothetical protein VJP45_07230 [Candidatus Limnocylindria bacterium]|nr:hypothetical protein [Candidatus Limnocylindria bacterium]
MQLDMGFGAFAVVIVAALVFGFLVQAFLKPKTPYEWVITGVGATLGGWLASEITWKQYFTGLTNLGPEVDGLLIVPAILGGLALGAIFEGVARVVEGPETTLA